MGKALILVSILNIVMLIAFAWHIRCNPELPKQNKRLLIASAFILILNLVMEDFDFVLDGHKENSALLYILVLVENLLSIWIVPALVKGFDFRREYKPVAIMSAVFTAVGMICAPFGLLFYISEDGVYTHGKLYILVQIRIVIISVVLLMILMGLSKKFKRREIPMLFMTGVLEVTGVVFSIISGYDILIAMTFSLVFMLVYSYYDGLSIQQTASDLKVSKQRIEELAMQMVNAMVSAVDAKDTYTNGHSKRVSEYAVLLAKALGWDADRLFELKYEGLLHDVGKIGIPDSVLNKQGRLSNAEFKIITSHTIFGSDILKSMDAVPGAYIAARWHHERYDGKGYPDGKKGAEIPESARIISIADTFDAMNSDRIYRRALPKDVIIRELEKGKGTQFDPAFTDVFIELFKSGAMDEIAVSGRRDAETDVDQVTEEIRDFFEMFYVASETTGGWEDNYTKTDRMLKYLLGMAKRNETDIEIAVVNVSPKKDISLSDTEFEAAVDVMLTALDSSVPELVACGRISKTQIVAIRRVVEGPDLAQFLQLAFVYYYKIYKADSVDIAFDLLGK